ncbi:hypothetical protein LX69_00354 [Breznakibacter xylanolyticus]|uniref:Uncharacterized protein n=2 Tax=Breznakibacter xylanolyticus TaxID=990 RepID=A0A2W7NQL0_9BACT|nr:hypothetical protein LX69_00354 [Breznakibacter xylanolyticus]
MIEMKQFAKVFMTLAVTMAVGALSAQKYDLKYTLKQGDKWVSKQVVEQNINQQVMGMANDMKVSMDATTSMVVESVADGNYHMTMTYDAMVMKIESPFMNMSYDSSQPADAQNPMAAAMGAVVGQTYRFVMTNKGKVLSVTGFDDLMSKLVTAAGGNESAAKQVAEGLKQQFSDEAIKSSIEMSSAMFPAQEVAIGETWTVETGIAMTVSMTNVSTMTLKEVKDGKWIVEGVSKLTSSKDKPIEVSGMTQHVDMNGTTTFYSEISATTGWVVASKADMSIDGTVTMEGGQLPAAMEIPMKIKGTVSSSVL